MEVTFIREPWSVACVEQQQKGWARNSQLRGVFLCEDLERAVGLGDEEYGGGGEVCRYPSLRWL